MYTYMNDKSRTEMSYAERLAYRRKQEQERKECRQSEILGDSVRRDIFHRSLGAL